MLTFFKKLLASFLSLSFKKQTFIVASFILILVALYYTQQYFQTKNAYLIEKVQKTSITETVTESGEILA
ncbi:MAG TPA: hypothetical protein VF810_01325, partial [Patescibacteria group bacterium]